MQTRLRRLVDQAYGVLTHSIRRQLVVGIVLVHAILMSIFVYDLVERQRNFLHQQAIAQTTSLAEALAANSTSWVLASDVVGLEEVIQSQRSYPGLTYAMIVSPRGRILSHTNPDYIGKYLTDPISTSLLNAPTKLQILVNERDLIDIATPVIVNHQPIAWARVGVSQEGVIGGLHSITRDGLVYTGLAIIIGALFAWFMARSLTGGLRQLVEIADRTARGERQLRSQLKRADELGQLSTDFNEMLDAFEHHENELQNARDHLHASEERFELAMKGSNDGLWDWDLNSNTVYYSPRWAEMLGYRADEIDNTREEWTNRLHPVDAELAEAEIQRHLNGETSYYENIHRIRHKDGSYRWHHEHGIAVRDADNKPYRMVSTNADITDRIRAENDLHKAKVELEERVAERTSELEEKNRLLNQALQEAKAASQAKSTFLANMSHEIRTPMNGLFGMLNLLKESKLNGNQIDYVNTAYGSAESLLTILNDILDFSKIEAGKLVLEAIDYSLIDILEETTQLFAGRAGDKGIELINDMDPQLPSFVIGDPTRLRQVLSNLVSNAIKFTDHGEVVTRSRVVERDGDQCTLRCEIQDSGIGISPDQVRTIFDSFSQADNTTTRKYGGTGLGLTISQQLVKLMGGEMGVESSLGKGSIFWFSVRLGISEYATADAIDIDQFRQQRVLIVDDSATNREILERQLEAWGLRLHTSVGSAHAALAELEAAGADRPYTLVLTDYMMPEMDGLKLAASIRQLPGFHPEIIMLTSAANHCDKATLEVLDIQACLSKPIRQSMLYDTLVNVFSSSATPARTVTGQVASAGVNPPTRQPTSGARILLVEDNLINQKVVAEILSTIGLTPDIAVNGRQAVALTQQRHYELIFMDCQMPEMDGFEATAAIRAQEAGQGPKSAIIALTANVMQGDRDRCIAVGMDDFIGKPFTTGEIRNMVKKWLPDVDITNLR